MTRRRLRRLIQAYGGEASRWPAAEREAALRRLAQSDEARTLQREAARLDRQLDGWAPAVEPGRAAQLLDAVSGRTAAEAEARAVAGSAPLVELSWRQAVAFGMVALLGFFLGTSGLIGEPAQTGSLNTDIFAADLMPWTRIGL